MKLQADKMLMNPVTGSVDTEGNWLAEMKDWETNDEGETPQQQFESLEEVVRDKDGNWIPVTEARKMRTFEVLVRRETTESCLVTVEAETAEEAMALAEDMDDLNWTQGDSNIEAEIYEPSWCACCN